MKKLTKAKAIKLLEKAVREKGEDYVDPMASAYGDTCANFIQLDGSVAPSCIAGHVYFYAGVTPPDDKSDEMWYAGAEDVAGMLKQDGVINITSTATRALQAAQRKQDRGGTWGQALEAAKEAN